MTKPFFEQTFTSDHRPTVFVGGPIQHALRGSSMLPDAQTPLCVVHGAVEAIGAHLVSAHIAERFGGDTHSFTPAEVTVRDAQWMRTCSLFVALLPVDASGMLIRTDGTHIELGWASALGKPIIVLAPRNAHPQLSHLVKGLGCVAKVDLLDLDSAISDTASLKALIKSRLYSVQSERSFDTESIA